MTSIADDLLPRCTVRITVRGQHSGTGFFVAPQIVATCAHVIESQSYPGEAIGAADLSVVDGAGHEHDVEVRAFVPKPKNDLALLRLRSASQHPCVLLDATPILARDKLHTFAFPKDNLEGVPRPLTADGRTGNMRWALGHGQVQRGMSGAPLLNLRTGGVCGIVNRTRGQQTDLGGYAVPVSVLLETDKA